MDFQDQYQDGSYLETTVDWHEQDAEWKAKHIRRLIDLAGISPRTIADIGCGTGGVLVQLQKMLPDDVQLTGYEIAKSIFDVAQARGNARLRFVNSAEVHADPPYDLALVIDVFEHIPDYLGFLNSIKPAADKFIFHIPLDLSMRCLHHDTPMARRKEVGHLHYFTTSTARATLEDCGYRVLNAFHTHSAMQPMPSSRLVRLKRWPDRWLFKRNPELCAKTLGGCSWLVLAEKVPA